MTLVERSHNAVLSRVLWELRPGKLHRSCTPPFPPPPPRRRGETNYIIAKPCAVHFFRVRSLWVIRVIGWSGSKSVIQDTICLDHDTSKEPVNLLRSYIHRFLWCTWSRQILDRWSGSGSPLRNATKFVSWSAGSLNCEHLPSKILFFHWKFSEQI